MSDHAPALLRTPPFHRSAPVLGIATASWSDLLADAGSARANSDPAPARQLDRQPDRQPDGAALLDALFAARVGGTFWGTRHDARGGIVVCMPGDPARAAWLWDAACSAHDVSRLTITWNTAARPTALVAHMRRCGATVPDDVLDPHALIDTAGEFVADGRCPDATALLGVLAGTRMHLPDDAARRKPPQSPGILHDAACRLLIQATRYTCPFRDAPMTAVEAVELLAHWRATILANRAIRVCVGMSAWKRRRIADMFATALPDRPGPAFRRGAAGAVSAAGPRGDIAVWSSRAPRGLAKRARAAAIGVARVEDGFIRSVGLGSGMLPPASIVVDRRGIYYDPSRPSDLEHILMTDPLGDELQARAARLMTTMIDGGISKYGGGIDRMELGLPVGRRTILVPGQVADDLSVRTGGAGIAGNLELLQRVRAACPEDFIIYRPHPDVDAGHRRGRIPDEAVLALADRVSRGGAMAPLLDAVDEIHTLTSLAGFEALMRRKPVTTYGQPFYAGWGLTRDHAPVARRTRRLGLEQLAAGTLIVYPRYIDPVTRLPCGPETLIARFADPAIWRPTPLMALRRRQGALRKAASKGVDAVFRAVERSAGRR